MKHTILRLVEMMKTYLVKKITPYIPESVPWGLAETLNDFCYPWEAEPSPLTTFQALHDVNNIYFRFRIYDESIKVKTAISNKKEIGFSDRVEIFFTTGSTMNPYYCLEMDPFGRVMDFRAKNYRDFDHSWNWPGLLIKGDMSDSGYSVCGQISLDSLIELRLLEKGILKVGLYRAKCMVPGDLQNGFKWISWINPQTQNPDFHVFSSFGTFILEDE